MPKVMRRLNTGDVELNRVQDAILPPLNALLSIPILDGRLLETETNANGQEIAIVLGTTPRNIAHKLGRAYRGWFYVDKDANADIWVDPPVGTVDPNPDHTLFLRLDASSTVTVKIWVF